MSRKPPVSGHAMLSEQARSAARQAIPAAVSATSAAAQQAAPIARQAMPLARSAGMSVRQGTDGAIAWATPYTDAARAWAAPKLEQSAVAVSENLAPKISGALVAAAHKIDTRPAPRQHRLGRASLLGASMVLIGAGAATALSLRKRGNADSGDTSSDSAGSAGSVRVIGEDAVEQDWVDPGANGHPHTG